MSVGARVGDVLRGDETRDELLARGYGDQATDELLAFSRFLGLRQDGGEEAWETMPEHWRQYALGGLSGSEALAVDEELARRVH